jgi:hypothetical protein
MQVISPTRPRFFAGLLACAAVIAVACQDGPTTPSDGAPSFGPEPSATPRLSRKGESHEVQIYIPADSVSANKIVTVDSSINFEHVTYVRATVEGQVVQHSNYEMYWTSGRTWTADSLSVTVSTAGGYTYPISGAGRDIGLVPSMHTPSAAGFGTINPTSRGLDNYTPPGYPRIECGPSLPSKCVTYTGGFTVKLVPYHSDLGATLDSLSYLPGSIAKLKTAPADSFVNGNRMNLDEDSVLWSGSTYGANHLVDPPTTQGPSECRPSCTHSKIAYGSSDWTVNGYVNGEYQTKTVQVKGCRTPTQSSADSWSGQ